MQHNDLNKAGMGSRNSTSKTEKKVSDSGQSPSASKVRLLVHVWSGGSAQGLPPPPLAVAMVEDLLSVSRCELTKGTASPVESVFLDIALAVNAARRIARLIRSFCAASEEGALDGCLTLSGAAELTPELDLPLLQQIRILDPTRPGQVLLVGMICEEARVVPGLHFIELSGGVVKAKGAGMRNLTLQLLPPDGMEEADARAIVFKPSRPKPRVQAVAVASEPVGMSLRSPVDGIERPDHFATLEESKSASLAWFSSFSAGKALLQRALPVRPPKLMGKVAISAIAAVATFTAAVVYIAHSRSHKVPTDPISRSTQARPSELRSATPESTRTNDVIKTAPASHPIGDVASRPPSTKAKMADPVHARTQPKTEMSSTDAPAEKAIDRGVVSFTARDINDLIEKADKEVGDGNFDAAISHYSIVLKHDPANVRAKQGIARARRNKGSE